MFFYFPNDAIFILNSAEPNIRLCLGTVLAESLFTFINEGGQLLNIRAFVRIWSTFNFYNEGLPNGIIFWKTPWLGIYSTVLAEDFFNNGINFLLVYKFFPFFFFSYFYWLFVSRRLRFYIILLNYLKMGVFAPLPRITPNQESYYVWSTYWQSLIRFPTFFSISYLSALWMYFCEVSAEMR